MKFIAYEDVPLAIGNSKESNFIFASNASLSVSQDLVPKRYVDDNKIRICTFGNGSASSYPYASPSFTNGSTHIACFGPTNGPLSLLLHLYLKYPKIRK